MTTQYTILFRLDVFHSYFDNEVCTCLRYITGPVTRKLQERYGFILRYHVNGFSFYSNTKMPLADQLEYITKTTGDNHFDFLFLSKDAAFSSFTELPVNWLGQLLYNSNVSRGQTADGIVQLQESFSENALGKTPGILSIHFDDIIKFRADTGYASFCIRMQARKTQWQYFVVNKSGIALNNPLINGNDDFHFEGPVQVNIASGETALFFSSGENRIPLSSTPRYRFNLENVESSSGKKPFRKIIFKGLPNPDPGRMGMATSGGSACLSSPMYVYV